MSNQRNKNILIYSRLALLLIATTLYFPSLFYEFTYDDAYQVVKSTYVTSNDYSIKQLFSIFTEATFPGDLYRPIVSFSLRLNYFISDLVPWSYHLTNILLHSLICTFCFQLLYKLKFSLPVAFVASLIFAVNPIHVEAVANIYNRTELLAAFFGLIGVVNFLYYQESKQRIYLISSLATLFLAFLAKESALTLIGIIFAISFFKSSAKNFLGKIKESCKPLVPYLLLVLAYLLLRSSILPNSFIIKANLDFYPAENPLLNFSFSERILPSLFLIGEYLRLSLLPLILTIDYSFPANYFKNLLTSGIALSAQLIFLALIIAIYKFRQNFKVVFGLLWFILTISITCNLIWPIGTIFAERLAYLPSLGLGLFFSQIIFDYIKNVKFRYALISIYLLLLSFLTTQQLPIWKNNISLFSYASESNTVSAKASYNLGITHKQRGNYKKCAESLKDALYRDPTYIKAVVDIITCSYYEGEYKSTLYWSKKYLKHKPKDIKILTFKALALSKLQ